MASNPLIAEQQKIQRQIEALQRRLAPLGSVADEPLSSSDLSDDDGLEGSNQGQAVMVQEDIVAERERIQREIEDLERTLGPDASRVDIQDDDENDNEAGDTTDSSEDDSSEELNLPQTVETCLQMNLVYQKILEEKLVELERLLRENQEHQREVTAQVSGSVPQPGPSGVGPQKVFMGSFLKPYFKDKVTGFGPPANSETRDKMNKGTRTFDLKKIQRWEGWQKSLLLKSVVGDAMKRLLQPKLSKVDYLTEKMSKANDMEKQIIQKQIIEIEKEMGDISAMREEDLAGSRHDDHDWEKIANVDFEGTRSAEDMRRFWENYLHLSINKSCWKEEEIEKLRGIVEQHQSCNWDQIAEDLGTNRTAFMCLQTHQRYINKNFKKKAWTKEEDEVLRDLVDKMRIGNFIPYTQISYFMEGREAAQLIYRWTQVLDPTLRKGHWTKEEDEMLLKAVAKYGVRDWWKIRNEVPGRNDGQCRDRYLDCLREDVKKGRWSQEEESMLIRLVEKYGAGRWAKIASEIPNRIDSQCLQKWKLMTGVKTKLERTRKSKGGKRRRRRNRSKRRTKKKREELDRVASEEEEEEEEGEEPVYMDSEDEAAPPRNHLANVRNKYIQPKIDEWVPKTMPLLLRLGPGVVRATPKNLVSQMEAEGKSKLGRIRSQNSVAGKHEPVGVRSTILDKQGCPLEVIMEVEPFTQPPEKERQFENEMIRVSLSEVKNLIRCPGNSASKQQKTCLLGQTGLKRTVAGGRGQQASANSSAKDSKFMNSQLLVAVLPWMGNMLLPFSSELKRRRVADVVRLKGEAIGLSSTPVFKLLLSVLRIDAEGCKKVIEKKRIMASKTPVQAPPPWTRRKRVQPNTVAEMLYKKRCQEEKLSQEKSQAFVPCLVVPQNVLFTQVLVPAVPPGLVPQPGSGEGAAKAVEAREETLPKKRARKPTEKALTNKARIKRIQPAPKQQIASMQPVLPKGEAFAKPLTWVMTPTGLLPVSGLAMPLAAGGVTSPAPVVLNQQVSLGLTAGAKRAKPLLQVKDASRGPGLAPLTLSILSPGVTTASPVAGMGSLSSSKSMEMHGAGLGSPGISSPTPTAAQTSTTSLPAGQTAVQQKQALPFIQLLHPSGPVTAAPKAPLPVPAPQKNPDQVLQPGASPVKATPPPHQGPGASPLSLDPSLMFLEEESQVMEWMKGTGGVKVPQLDVTLPYLPPFVSSLMTLTTLLQRKRALEWNALKLVGSSGEGGNEEARLDAVRKLVAEKLSGNPAYLLLKARFLSCFTLPALLATIHPLKRPKSSSFLSDDSSEAEVEDEAKKEAEKEAVEGAETADGDTELRSIQSGPLSTAGAEEPGAFTGITTRRRRRRLNKL
ncbi:snRNA-activating protein complex subunit 4 isoform X2 [Brienomyrus brachyistius]|uniref:snRNA-activating protein complex subunit 4 isoform X2 n=1 Tax=Brienomyrus brachyistius TaxID=42636 RepID=UPI0020B2752C|nr:snRNA-activating protein complex subunit 4 isoform X2 [Brienomyrus brachyistius]